jgi:hypothetical protein
MLEASETKPGVFWPHFVTASMVAHDNLLVTPWCGLRGLGADRSEAWASDRRKAT